MIAIEELCADNRKLVDENLKLRKENAELKKKLKEKLKTIADKDLSFVAKFDALENENALMRELLKTLNESIVMTADDTFWSLKEDVEKFLEENK